MEFVEGGSLKDLVYDEAVQLDKLTVVRIAKDVAGGMGHIHKEGLLHCDLGKKFRMKVLTEVACRNLLVASKGHGKFTVKIADFGLSRTTETGIYNAKEDKKFPVC